MRQINNNSGGGSDDKSTVVYTWGIGTEGQLGHQKFEVSRSVTDLENVYTQEEPRRLIKSKKFTQIACGEQSMYAITNSGELFGWGADIMPKVKSNEPIMLPLPDGTKIVQVAAGPKHAAAIDSEGQVLSWGSGGSWFKGGGQLGHGSTSDISKPT